mgnify:CR=1 FL=1
MYRVRHSVTSVPVPTVVCLLGLHGRIRIVYHDKCRIRECEEWHGTISIGHRRETTGHILESL